MNALEALSRIWTMASRTFERAGKHIKSAVLSRRGWICWAAAAVQSLISAKDHLYSCTEVHSWTQHIFPTTPMPNENSDPSKNKHMTIV